MPLLSYRRWLSSSGQAAQTPPAGFTYSVAASYIAKDHPYDPSAHVFHFNPYNRLQQTRNKRSRPESGQDAFFVSRMGNTDGVALGVADGVGGWMDSGVDPADFSHTLCHYMAAIAYDHNRPAQTPEEEDSSSPSSSSEAAADRHRHHESSSHHLTARQLLQKGYDAVCRDSASVKAGGSTAVVGLLGPDGVLEVANLGDSGFMHLRLNAVHSVSEAQVHAFNTPFQLSVIPRSVMRRMAAFGGAQLSDLPRDSEVSRHRLQHGDVLVFASDGLWDNLFHQDILRIVSRVMLSAGAWRPTDAGIQAAPDLSALTMLRDATATTQTQTPPGGGCGGGTPRAQHPPTLQSAIATLITGAAKDASVNTKRDGPFAKEVKKSYPNETWQGGKVDDICVVVAVVQDKAALAGAKSKL